MVAANEAVARALAEHGIPVLSRLHEPPHAEKIADLQVQLQQMGLTPVDLSKQRKLARILADRSCRDFILADAKDADMAFGLAAPGRSPEHYAQEARFRTLDEYEYVRTRLEPVLAQRLAERGFVVLFWGDAGWVRIFTRRQAVRPDDFRSLKVFVTAGDNEQFDLMRSSGFTPVFLDWADALTGLQTGMIDAVPTIPFFALSALSGQLADMRDKARIIRIVKLCEILIMLVGGAGLVLTWQQIAVTTAAIPLMLLALFAMGIHSTFFGPMPGISSSSLVRVRASRRLRWKVTAKRCASSRIICTRCSTGERWSRITGSSSCP